MNFTWPEPDWADIRPADTLASWLIRTCPLFSWVADGSGEDVIGYLTSEYEPAAPHYTPRLTSTEFYRQFIAPLRTAPIWPGLAYVTLGTPLAIAGGLTITEPMHGVLVQITAVDPKQLYFTYHDILAYRHIGALAFVSDNGDVEAFQPLGFSSAIYVPKSMALAAAVKVMTPGGTVGTVTPWIRDDTSIP